METNNGQRTITASSQAEYAQLVELQQMNRYLRSIYKCAALLRTFAIIELALGAVIGLTVLIAILAK